jgi:cytochrome P450
MTTTIPAVERFSPPQASVTETLGVVAGVILPVFARGVIIRRPKMVALAERLDLDTRAVRRVQRLRDKHGAGPLMLRIPIRRQALLLHPDHVQQALDGSPEPFATATREKRAALSHFQPKGVLISHGAERADRRRFNEEVLDTAQITHRLASRFIPVVDEEAAVLLKDADRSGELAWDEFAETWFRVVRRVVFGDAARDDHELTDMIARLRSDANWAFMKPQRKSLRDRFYQRMSTYLERAEDGSLAAMMAAAPTTEKTAPEQQVPQWLFAFDPAGMTTFRALALLVSHPRQLARARDEIIDRDASPEAELLFLRATVLESLRLWPTTPMVLRESTEKIMWDTGIMPENTHVIIFANFFHRDDQNLAYANTFTPDLWLEERVAGAWPLIPFSDGPAICPGRHLVQMLTSHMLANILDGREVRLTSHRKLREGRDIPGTLNNYALRFSVTPMRM